MTTQSFYESRSLCCSLQSVQATFAHESINVVRYRPPLVNPASTDIDDIYAWLHILPAEPGWLLRDTLWVCASADEAASLARLRARALRHTNMGDLYAAPATLAVTADPDSWQHTAYACLRSGEKIDEDARLSRRFVCCNLVLECVPHPRGAANQQRTDRLIAVLHQMPVDESC